MLNRRQFLKRTAGTAAAVGFPCIVPGRALGLNGAVPANSRIVVGCIGSGGQGRYDLNGFLDSPDAQVVAICDVKPEAREAARQQVDGKYGQKGCEVYNDFRELLARKDIDCVLIASPDHWHVLHALAAVRAGKDVYVEKPLGLSLHDAFILRETAHRYGRLFQFGTQQRSMPQFRSACELVRNGRIGQLKSIKVSAPSGFAERTGKDKYTTAPVPEGFDYEMWLGPAPAAPYTPRRVATPFWYHNSDYALGYIAGWGIHHVDIAQWGNDTELTGPVEIEGSGVFPAADALCDTALNWDCRMKYANGVTMHYTSDGGPNKHGVLFEGTEGWVHVDRNGMDAHPKSLLKEKFRPDEIHLPVSMQHQQNLLDCMRTREQPICNIDVAVRTETICHLADIAMRLGRPLRWDPQQERFPDDEAANRRMKRAMRAPWHL
ncbi:MAG TPA: Gfo/Idh/MocA family oxidoreductase [Phycisphaerae bacterium]|jgi:predicted dehydrogenase|nr:Gfo/Idh/MocA family oxidoreductase [Phycisphaerae bacterium]HOB76378.1 Gfo/Idh/MocA family oxidoreductase [Phycisphaerae bacterium]HOJ53510.1 Gfo/Idh/MocA family oxidoreductase [Phycisphaerae bacterium]HOL25333.1 Gfo/Idh/MocA family oxidoreductase [Phycisphaerae bacterium]HPU32170.1 Gfo/Idh/MocA family oxidoreductase [Phycisphaerae bacterium]